MKRAPLVVTAAIGLAIWISSLFGGQFDQSFWWCNGSVLDSMFEHPGGVPEYLLHQAECVVIVPSVSSGLFGWGANSGRAVLICRGAPGFEGPWGAPVIYHFQGKGAPIGPASHLLLVMTSQGVDRLLSGKVELGTEVSVAPGALKGDRPAPVPANILAYSCSDGRVAGASMDGATLKEDVIANRSLYGERTAATQVVLGRMNKPTEIPSAASGLAETLQSMSPKNWSNRRKLGFPRFP